MGNSNSTRRITVPNDENDSVIRYSDTVVKRILGECKEAESGEAAGSQTDVRIANAETSQVDAASKPSHYYPPADSMTAFQIRQEKEEELRRNDAYWAARMKKQLEAHKQMNRYMQEQYAAAVEEVLQTLPGCKDAINDVPCNDAKENLIKCYKEHPHETLKCAHLVHAFQACVDAKRVTIEQKRR